MFDIVAIGEILIDFTPIGKSDQGGQLFEQNPEVLRETWLSPVQDLAEALLLLVRSVVTDLVNSSKLPSITMG